MSPAISGSYPLMVRQRTPSTEPRLLTKQCKHKRDQCYLTKSTGS
jgi:hypothetical protein